MMFDLYSTINGLSILDKESIGTTLTLNLIRKHVQQNDDDMTGGFPEGEKLRFMIAN